MATTARRTETTDELPDLMKRLSREPIAPEVIELRRRLSAAANKVVDELEPLEEGVEGIIIWRQEGEKPGG